MTTTLRRSLVPMHLTHPVLTDKFSRNRATDRQVPKIALLDEPPGNRRYCWEPQKHHVPPATVRRSRRALTEHHNHNLDGFRPRRTVVLIYVQVGVTHSFNDTAKCFEVSTRCLSQEQRAWCSSLCQRPSTCSLQLGHLYSPTRPEPRHGIATGRQKKTIPTGRQYYCFAVDAAHTPRRIGTPICSVATFMSTVECQDIDSHSSCKKLASFFYAPPQWNNC